MKEFTEDEKIIARNIDKKYKWLVRHKDGRMTAFARKPYKDPVFEYWTSRSKMPVCGMSVFSEMFKSITWEDDEPTLIRDIYDSRILDDAEKEYLAAALKPLTKVKCIIKARSPIYQEREYLGVNFETGEVMVFPFFEEQTMYKGMKTDKAYTPEELGLDL